MNKNILWLILVVSMCAPAAVADPTLQSGPAPRVLSLREALRMALARGPEVLMAQAEVARAIESLREARSSKLPQITAGTGLAYNNGFPLSIEGSAPSIFQAGASQSIFSKKNDNLIRESEAGADVSKAGTDRTRNELAARTILFYNELHQSNLLLPVLEEQLATARKNIQTMETLLEAGRARPLDLTQAKLASASLDHQLLAVRERAHLAEVSLRELTGASGSEPIQTERPELNTDLLTLPADEIYRRIFEVHPEIREAEANLRAREFHLEAEKGEKYPQFSIISQYALFSKTNNYQDFFNRFTRNNYIIGLSVQVPLFDGSRTGARVAQSRQDAEIARLQMQRLKSDLKLSLEKVASEARVAGDEVVLAHLEVVASEERVQVSESMREAGRIDPKELSDAHAQLLEKRAAAIEAERALIERQVALLLAAGALTSMF